MHYLGKLLGFIAGWMLAGPFGAFFGLIIGQYFDLSAAGYWKVQNRPYQRTQHTFHRQEAQQAFFKATFLIMGHIAKADGRVSEGEIQAAMVVMRNMRLNPAMKREAIDLFTQGKEARFDLKQTLDNLVHSCQGQSDVLRMFIDIQFQAAAAEGPVGPHKKAILEYLCRQMGFNAMDFLLFSQRFHGYQSGSGQRQYRSAGSDRTTYNPTAEDPYKILGVNQKASNAEIKKAYRKKISENHPDKLVAKGLPEEMIKLANRKTAEIKKAYDSIAKVRGIA